MKNALMLIAVVVLAGAANSQNVKHAPTLESCQADINLWEFQMVGWPSATSAQEREATKNLTFHEINGRVISLGECMGAHPMLARNKGPDVENEFLALAEMYNEELQLRLSNFLERHSLKQKFIDEDAAGKR